MDMMMMMTSKTGQSVAQNRQKIFCIWTLLQIGLVSEIEQNEQEFLPF